jgi:hypothetical protein
MMARPHYAFPRFPGSQERPPYEGTKGLHHRANIPRAMIQAKSNRILSAMGMQHAFDYATTLDIP